MFGKGAIVIFMAILGSSCIRGKPTEIISTTETHNETSKIPEISIMQNNGNETDGGENKIVPLEIKFKDMSGMDGEEFRKIIDNIMRPVDLQSDDSISYLSSFPSFEIKSFWNDLIEQTSSDIEKEFKQLVEGRKAVKDETSEILIVIPDAEEDSTAASTNEDSSSVTEVNDSNRFEIINLPNSEMGPSNKSTVESKGSENENEVPESSAGFVANDDFKLAVKGAVKSAVSEVISELLVDVAKDILHNRDANKLLKFKY